MKRFAPLIAIAFVSLIAPAFGEMNIEMRFIADLSFRKGLLSLRIRVNVPQHSDYKFDLLPTSASKTPN